MKFTNEREFQVGDDGIIVVCEPTAKQLNQFNAAAYQYKKGKGMNNSTTVSARADLFDVIFVRCENLEDNEGPISEPSRIPVRIKNDIILHFVEAGETEEKNL